MELERLGPPHEAAMFRFETANREWFARSVPDRGDSYFADFPARHVRDLRPGETTFVG